MPLVLAVVVLVMNMLGMDLNRITLGTLIITLGLLVDDAIIAVEMMAVKMEQGWMRERAAAFAWISTAFPMLTHRHRLRADRTTVRDGIEDIAVVARASGERLDPSRIATSTSCRATDGSCQWRRSPVSNAPRRSH